MDDRDRYATAIMRSVPQRRAGERDYRPGQSAGVEVRPAGLRPVKQATAWTTSKHHARRYPAATLMSAQVFIMGQLKLGHWCGLPEVHDDGSIYIRSWGYK